MTVVKTCERCGKEFKVNGKRVQTARFCSKECMTHHPRICTYCGKEYECFPRLKRKYCSQVCYMADHNRKPLTEENIVTCAYCGKTFVLSNGKIRRSNNLYCSQACMGKAQRKEPKRIPTKDELIEMYEVKKMSKEQIANDIGSTVWVAQRLLSESGIESRTRNEWGKASWEKDTGERRELISAITSERMKNYIHTTTVEQRRKFAVMGAIASCNRNGPTSIERKMIDRLNRENIPFVFQFQVGGKFLCDFAFPDHMLIVECDGIYWHSKPNAIIRDKGKNNYLKKCGYTVLRFTDVMINKNIDGCISEIVHHLNISDILARNIERI